MAANECTHGTVKNTQRKQAWHGRGRVCSRYDVGGSMGAGWGPFYLRARRVRRQKQLTLVDLTLDTFLMFTCEVGCSAGSLERPRLPSSYVSLGSPPSLTSIGSPEYRSPQFWKHGAGN